MCVLLAVMQLLASATTESVVYHGRTLEGGEGGNPGDQQSMTVLDDIDTEAKSVAKDTRVCSCSSTGGWTRIAHLNTSDPSQQCPDAWRVISTPRRMCGRSTTQKGGCDSAIFLSHGLQYSHVCGRVLGYQYESPYAFIGPINSIDSPYVDGVSITHGAPGSRQHVWTFAASYSAGFCPCSYDQSIPTFVGQDYFCETGNDDNVLMYKKWFINDPLWDGQDCGGYSSACECTFNSPPGFCKQLPQATTDDIEVRICADERTGFGDSAVEAIELYIQ